MGVPDVIGLDMLKIESPWPNRGVELRLRQDEDLPFLRRLYHSTRQHEVQAAGLDVISASRFLDQQFDYQSRHYDALYTMGGRRFIITAAGQAVGRVELWNDDRKKKNPLLHLVDISLLPDWRNKGLGSALMRAIQDLARQENRSVSLHVLKGSAAERLYLRHGFCHQEDTGDRWKMIWRRLHK